MNRRLLAISIGGWTAATTAAVWKNAALVALIGIGAPAAGAGFVVAVLHTRANAVEADRVNAVRGQQVASALEDANFAANVRSALLVGRQLIDKGRAGPARELLLKVDQLVEVGSERNGSTDDIVALRGLREKLSQTAYKP
jgi:hypothetical protein